ncbi:MAG: CRTAC1 family protein [Planctomycetota bacterium]
MSSSAITRAASLVLLPAATMAPLSAQSNFTQHNQFGSSNTIGIAWRDCDNDSDLDLAVGNVNNQTEELFVNNGDGTFTRQTPFGSGSSTFAVVWADYDNDGDADLAVGNIGQNYLFANAGSSFVPLAMFGQLRTIALAWADFDRDGDLDMAVGNGILGNPEQNYLYIRGGGFSARPEFGVGQTDSVAWGDFDNDGDPDLAVGNGGFGWTEQNYLYVNNGDGSFTGRPEFGLADTACVAWGDANGDGWLDLAVGNWNAGQSYLYLNNRDGSFTEQAPFRADDTNTLAWGDWDLDGDLDLAVGNGDFTSAGQNYLYHNDGQGNFTAEPQFGLGSTDSVAWGDYDNDGDLDLAVGNEHSPPQNWLYLNNLASRSLLRIRLVGQFHVRGAGFSNRDAVGAQVRVYAAGHAGDPAWLRGMQQVEAQGGFGSQNDQALTFGLLQDSAVDAVIRWSGSANLVQKLLNVPVNQRITVLEARVGDLNCDGLVNFGDINPFVLALSDPAGYRQQYPDCTLLHGDVNGDGRVDFGDINPFVALLAG